LVKIALDLGLLREREACLRSFGFRALADYVAAADEESVEYRKVAKGPRPFDPGNLHSLFFRRDLHG
jgi:hypothetical protein